MKNIFVMLFAGFVFYANAYILIPVAYHNNQWHALMYLSPNEPSKDMWKFFRVRTQTDVEEYTNKKIKIDKEVNIAHVDDIITIEAGTPVTGKKDLVIAPVDYIPAQELVTKEQYKYIGTVYAWIPFKDLLFADFFDTHRIYDFDKQIFKTRQNYQAIINHVKLPAAQPLSPLLYDMYDHLETVNVRIKN